MDLGLGGRGYLLTGASRGLGFATARALVDDGARVLISARGADSVDAAVAELGGAPAAFGDDGRPRRPRAPPSGWSTEARERLGRLDGALISVGGPAPGAVFDDDGRRLARGARERGARPAAAGPGAACRTSARARRSASCCPRRCASRCPGWPSPTRCGPGLAMTIKSLGDELGPRGIRVFGLMPGTIATDRMAELEDGLRRPAAARARTEAGIPLRRVGRAGGVRPGGGVRCSPPPPPTSPARCSPSTAAGCASREPAPERAPVLVACAHGTRNPTGRRLIAELALAARALRPGPGHDGGLRRRAAARPSSTSSPGWRPRDARPSSSPCCCRAATTCTSTSPARSPAHPAAVAARPLGPGPAAGRGAARPAACRPAPTRATR